MGGGGEREPNKTLETTHQVRQGEKRQGKIIFEANENTDRIHPGVLISCVFKKNWIRNHIWVHKRTFDFKKNHIWFQKNHIWYQKMKKKTGAEITFELTNAHLISKNHIWFQKNHIWYYISNTFELTNAHLISKKIIFDFKKSYLISKNYILQNQMCV